MSDNQTEIVTTVRPSEQTVIMSVPKRRPGRIRIATRFIGFVFGNLRKRKKAPVYKHSDAAGRMSLLGHLAELRDRLIKCSLAILIGTAIAGFKCYDIAEIMKLATRQPNLYATAPLDMFSLLLKISLFGGILLASPIIVYQILSFLSPALEPERKPGEEGYDEEMRILRGIKRSTYFVLPGTAIAFIAGVCFAYFVVVPTAIHFLYNIGGGVFTALPDAAKTLSVATSLIFWLGMIFELPIIMFVLAKLRLVTWKQLFKWWRYATIFAFVAAAFITPTPDPLGQVLVAVPILALYWLGILFARFA